MVQFYLATAFLALYSLPPLGAAVGLNSAAKAKGLMYFGTATDNNELSNTAYTAILDNSQQFGQLTAGNSMKWGPTEPNENTYTYTQGDQIVDLAESNGQIMRCHNLVWYNQLPNWVTSGTWTNNTLLTAMTNHITSAVTHYKGQCYCWDVVNEALNDDGTYRSDVLYNTIGPAYIPIAFKTAAAIDPDAKMYYNDYNIETSGAKATAAQNIVKMIQSYGIRVDGVGLQSHFIVGETPTTSQQASNMASFTALGVEVAITELDIRMTLPSTSALLTQQGNDYYNTVSACVQTKNCVGITLWDFSDEYSWVPSTFSGQGAACPWDSNMNPKPAYTSILSALGAAATSGPTSSGSGSGSSATTSAPPHTTTPSSSGGTVAEWGQCGGQGYTGPTTCASGYTCHEQNPYYSQCY